MKEKIKLFKEKYLNKTLLWSTSIISIALGISLIIQVCRIYFTNKDNHPIFSSDNVGVHLLQISSILILWLLIVIVSGVYTVMKGRNKEKFPKMTNQAKLDRVILTLPDSSLIEDTDEYKLLKFEEKKRLIAKLVNCAFLILSIVMASCYTFNPNNFVYDQNPTGQIIQLVIHISPWLILSTVTSIITVYFNDRSASTSLELIKVITKSKGKTKGTNKTNRIFDLYVVNGIRAAVLIIAIVFIIYGAINGGVDGVFTKASNICTECIGLG